MDYFIIFPSDKILNPLKFNFTKKELDLNHPIIKYVDVTFYTEITDYYFEKILFYNYYFISDEIKKIFEIYEETICFRPIFITNIKHKFQKIYWHVTLPETENIIKNKCSEIKNAVFDIDRLKEKSIHKIVFQKQEYIAINLFVAESILRRLPIGICLKRIDIETGKLFMK